MNEPITEPANEEIVATDDMAIVFDRNDKLAESLGHKAHFRWFRAGETQIPYTWGEVVRLAGSRWLIHLHRGDVVS